MNLQRKNIMLGTAGHVDHGKTAVVKVLTGCDTDTLAEEKKRGLTIDLGFAPCRMADERIVGIIDVPGHVDFIRNMVAGAHGIDVVIFVVAADDGVMPQTREHLDILTLMGVKQGIIALTKIDLVDEGMRELAVEDVSRCVAGTFLEGKPICGVSNITGEGYDKFLEALNAAVEVCPPRTTEGLFRSWVEDVFKIHGFGAVVTGIPSSGEVKISDHLRLVGGAAEAVGRVRGLQVYGDDSTVGRSGECVAINLTDIDADGIGRGMVLCEGPAVKPVTMIEAELRLLDSGIHELKDYAEVHFHVGTAESMAHVAMLGEEKTIPGGGQDIVQFRLVKPLGVCPGDRYVIRASAAGAKGGHLTTIGGGRILDVSNTRLRRNRAWTLEALAARQAALDAPADWVPVVLKQVGGATSATALAEKAFRTMEQTQAALTVARERGLVMDAGAGQVVHRDVLAELSSRVKSALDEFHTANPLRVGLEQAELATKCETDAALLTVALADMERQKLIDRRGALVSLRGRGPKVSADDLKLCERIETILREAHLTPPSPAELMVSLAIPEKRLQLLLRLLSDQGAVVNLDPKVVMHRDAVEAGKKVVLDLFAKAAQSGSALGGFETVEFRDALGVSRKFAVPLLDYFDTVRLTARSGSRRTPGKAAKA